MVRTLTGVTFIVALCVTGCTDVIPIVGQECQGTVVQITCLADEDTTDTSDVTEQPTTTTPDVAEDVTDPVDADPESDSAE